MHGGHIGSSLWVIQPGLHLAIFSSSVYVILAIFMFMCQALYLCIPFASPTAVFNTAGLATVKELPSGTKVQAKPMLQVLYLRSLPGRPWPLYWFSRLGHRT